MENNTAIKALVESFISRPPCATIIQSEEFYFDRLSALFEEYKHFDVTPFKEKLGTFERKQNGFSFKQLLEDNTGTQYYEFLLLIGKMVAYIDEKGYNKRVWNLNPDLHVISLAGLRQDDWTYCFFQYKLRNHSFWDFETKSFLSFQNVIEYIVDPENQVGVTSPGHRQQISKYFGLSSEAEIATLFPEFTSRIRNPLNRGALVTNILYNPGIRNLWLDSVVGLMASDSTGWHDAHIHEIEGYDASILWNSKRPSGGKPILDALRSTIAEFGSFSLYYCSGGMVRYKATIIDFVDSQEGLSKRQFEKIGKVLYYSDKFENYNDTKKWANIVFLAKTIEAIEPIPVAQFQFYKDHHPPRQDNLSPLKAEPDVQILNQEKRSIDPSDSNSRNTMLDSKIPLNQILYGPPGTGKTYNTISKALKIINEAEEQKLIWSDRDAVTKQFRKRLEEGRIVFTTFHQSMSYEDFIEGIKPEKPRVGTTFLSYQVESGIFNRICKDAGQGLANLKAAIEKLKGDVSVAAGKQPLTIHAAYSNFDIEFRELSSGFHVHPEKSTRGDEGWIAVSFSNIEKGFLTGSNGTKSTPTYERGILKHIRKNLLAGEEKEKPDGLIPYVLIIDEINRGNVSQIFGELITLIEEDKRLGKDEELTITLPYSKGIDKYGKQEKFGVPPNLYIIGTMNTADRSVEALDAALRRRFSFEEMPPRPELIATEGELKEKRGILSEALNGSAISIDLPKLLDKINQRIEVIKDKDHKIGHSFFMKVANIDDLLAAFRDKILPLLQEYFYGDMERLRLVLGDGFFSDVPKGYDSKFFGKTDFQEAPDYSDHKIHRLKPWLQKTDKDYTAEVVKFNEAISKLLNP